MALPSGIRLGTYQIVGPLGAGGMGEVYRARDGKLNREVALKVLPDALAKDAQHLSRFQREAQMLAALNHPNIAAIYGLEEHEGRQYLVLELVEGQTLAERLSRGALTLGETLQIMGQIAEALEAAHGKGIIHRDLKPSNIKITPEGRVKVLDFGLAKETLISQSAGDILDSPTRSLTDTQSGMILGTAAYMSPEQARGKPVDARADIWSFGCVTYEAITGRAPFRGESLADILASIVNNDPDLNALPAQTPVPIRRLVRRCLQKDSRQRLHSIADARIEIDDVQRGPSDVIIAPAAAKSSAWIRVVPWVVSGLLAAVCVITVGSLMRTTGPTAKPVTKAAISLPTKTVVELGRGSALALSPDGLQLVYSGTSAGRTQLYIRSRDQLESTPMNGTEGGSNPFFSPDGHWVGFFAGGKLKKVAVAGGAPVVLCEAPNARGEAWGPDDTILLTPKNNTGIWRIPAGGGTLEPLTTLAKGELSHRWPQVLPGGKAVLFSIWNDTGFENGRIAVQSLTSGERTVLVTGGSFARYAAAGPDSDQRGYLIYARTEGLMAAPLDLRQLRVTGAAIPVLEGVITNLSGGAHYTFSPDGSLAYLPGGMGEADRTMVWVDRQGAVLPAASVPNMSLSFGLSPDGRRLARHNSQGDRDIWIHDLERGLTSRLTLGGFNQDALWTLDGKRVVFSSGVPNNLNLYWQTADESKPAERLTTSAMNQFANSWHPDGKTLAFTQLDPVLTSDIWILSVEGDRKVRPFVQTPFSESNAAFSPDGRWLAYESNESGRFEVYAQAFPDGGRKVQISTEGGVWPRWNPAGNEIFYVNGAKLMTVSITTQPEFKTEIPKTLFEGRYDGDFQVAPDGKRFLRLKGSELASAPTQVVLVLNWFEELKRRLPPPKN